MFTQFTTTGLADLTSSDPVNPSIIINEDHACMLSFDLLGFLSTVSHFINEYNESDYTTKGSNVNNNNNNKQNKKGERHQRRPQQQNVNNIINDDNMKNKNDAITSRKDDNRSLTTLINLFKYVTSKLLVSRKGILLILTDCACPKMHATAPLPNRSVSGSTNRSGSKINVRSV